MESICGSIGRAHPPPTLSYRRRRRPPTPPPYRFSRRAVPTHPTHTPPVTQTAPPGQRNGTLGAQIDSVKAAHARPNFPLPLAYVYVM